MIISCQPHLLLPLYSSQSQSGQFQLELLVLQESVPVNLQSALHYRKELMTDQIESEAISAVLYDVVKHPSAFDVSQKLREVCHGYHSSGR